MKRLMVIFMLIVGVASYSITAKVPKNQINPKIDAALQKVIEEKQATIIHIIIMDDDEYGYYMFFRNPINNSMYYSDDPNELEETLEKLTRARGYYGGYQFADTDKLYQNNELTVLQGAFIRKR